jgi:hypothetical protein
MSPDNIHTLDTHPGANVIKLFTGVSYEFCKKLVFVGLGWKSLPGKNTLAYYKNLQITEKTVL